MYISICIDTYTHTYTIQKGALEKFAALVYFSLAENYLETVVSKKSDWQAEEAA